MVRLIADEFLTEERDRKYYADHYKCWPPPLFVIAVTLIQVSADNSPCYLSICFKMGVDRIWNQVGIKIFTLGI